MPGSRSGVLTELEHYPETAFRSQLTSGQTVSILGRAQELCWDPARTKLVFNARKRDRSNWDRPCLCGLRMCGHRLFL